VVFGSLFAGQLNSGINAAWVLVYLSEYPEWQQKVREQIESVAVRHCPDSPLSLLEQLCSLPMSIWETEFPLIELCLKDCIRLQIVGTGMPRNVSGHTTKLGDTLVPDGAFVTYPFVDAHHDKEVYPEPEKWDPSRYLPEKAEHTKKPYCFLGWGAGKHPCRKFSFPSLKFSIDT
jgi:cytochrome P450